MTDRKMVIRGLEYCAQVADDTCDECPYDEGFGGPGCAQLAKDALALLNTQESEWLEDSDPGQEYGTTWACRKCMCSIHKPYVWNPYNSGYKYCLNCGAKMRR